VTVDAAIVRVGTRGRSSPGRPAHEHSRQESTDVATATGSPTESGDGGPGFGYLRCTISWSAATSAGAPCGAATDTAVHWAVVARNRPAVTQLLRRRPSRSATSSIPAGMLRCAGSPENFCTRSGTLTYGGVDRHGRSTTLGATPEYVVRDGSFHPLPPVWIRPLPAPLLCAGVPRDHVWNPCGVGPHSRRRGDWCRGHFAVKSPWRSGPTPRSSAATDKADDARRLGAHASSSRRTRNRCDGRDRSTSSSAPSRPDMTSAPTCAWSMDGHSATRHSDPSRGDIDLLCRTQEAQLRRQRWEARDHRMLDFCAEHGITAHIELLPSSRV